MNELIEAFNFPSKSFAGKKLTKKMFIEQPGITAQDKKLIVDTIETISVQYVLTPETMNLPNYDDEVHSYREILIIEIVMKSIQNQDRVSKTGQRLSQLIHMMIPHPVIVILSCEPLTTFTLAQKRKSLSDHNKTTLETHLITEWFDLNALKERQRELFKAMEVKNFSYANQYSFYSDLENLLLRFNLSKHIGSFGENTLKGFDTQTLKQKTATIMELDNHIGELKTQLHKESNYNNKVSLNVGIMKWRKKRETLINELMEEH